MINGVGGPNGLPFGYGIGKVQPVNKAQMDVKKDREKQNEEKRANLVQQKAFLEELRRQQENVSKEQGEEIRHFDRRA